MTRAFLAIALLVPGAAPLLVPAAPTAPAPQQSLCVPAPPRTTPRRKLERVDKWQHDERTLA